MDDVAQAAQTIAKFLQTFTSSGGLRLRFKIKARGVKPSLGAESADASEESSHDQAEHPEHPRPDGQPSLYVEFSGPDTPILVARNAEVLNALEHIAAKILRLEPEDHDRLSFDAEHFKANRDRQLREMAAAAIERVRLTERPHSFPPMTSRERRMIHMILKDSGLPTASSGEGPGRFVVLYPAGADTSEPQSTQPPRRSAEGVRKAFRPR